ncbi:MAG: hypothetical protein MUO23_03610 [Anaerolineales bacterium]|nr:hypothetical protein [Anaerolineales bacterium]
MTADAWTVIVGLVMIAGLAYGLLVGWGEARPTGAWADGAAAGRLRGWMAPEAGRAWRRPRSAGNCPGAGVDFFGVRIGSPLGMIIALWGLWLNSSSAS